MPAREGEGILRCGDALARRELLFDLNDLAVFDPIGMTTAIVYPFSSSRLLV
jgi:hypothetical protein